MIQYEQRIDDGQRNRIAIVMPYFGRLPAYFGAYLASLQNKHLDVLWISDLPVSEHPDNFKIVPMTFEECKAQIADRLGVPVCIDEGRRLCDFRPMYGVIFKDLLSEYDYWGFGDCDLVYGAAFNDFLDQTVVSGDYDVISLDAEYLSGPTCFFRNDERMRGLYQKARNWQEVCAQKGPGGVLCFDECGGLFHSELKAGTMTLEDCSRIRDSFSAVVWREPNLRLYHKDVINECPLNKGELVSMRDGMLTRNGVSLVVYHFIHAKCFRWFHIPVILFEQVRNYRIEATGFYYGEWQWRTRVFRRIFRYFVAVVGCIRDRGIRHLIHRFGQVVHSRGTR